MRTALRSLQQPASNTSNAGENSLACQAALTGDAPTPGFPSPGALPTPARPTSAVSPALPAARDRPHPEVPRLSPVRGTVVHAALETLYGASRRGAHCVLAALTDRTGLAAHLADSPSSPNASGEEADKLISEAQQLHQSVLPAGGSDEVHA